MIAKDSKNCPKCGVCIYRIEGCNQMFCVSCHTAFDWKSLTIINKGIHNPHYFQWLNRNNPNSTTQQQQTAQQQLDACGNRNLVDYWQIKNRISRFSITHRSHIQSLWQSVHHIHNYRPQLRANNNEDLRCKYLTNELTEDKVKALIHQRLRKQRFNQAVCNVIEMLYNATIVIGQNIMTLPEIDLSGRILHSLSKEHSTKMKQFETDIINQLTELARYYNQSMYQVHESFKSSADFEAFTPNLEKSRTDRKRFMTSQLNFLR